MKKLVERWIKRQFCGELRLDGGFNKAGGEYYAEIILGGKPPNGTSCWESGYFHLKSLDPLVTWSSKSTY